MSNLVDGGHGVFNFFKGGNLQKKKIGKPRFKPKWKKQRITLPGNLKQQLYPDLQY